MCFCCKPGDQISQSCQEQFFCLDPHTFYPMNNWFNVSGFYKDCLMTLINLTWLGRCVFLRLHNGKAYILNLRGIWCLILFSVCMSAHNLYYQHQFWSVFGMRILRVKQFQTSSTLTILWPFTFLYQKSLDGNILHLRGNRENRK